MENVDPLVQAGLDASSFIFRSLDDHLKTIGTEDSASIALSRRDIKKLKRASLAMNKAFISFVKASHAREDRLTIEQHILRQAARRDTIDKDANRARVFEKLRASLDGARVLSIDAPPVDAGGSSSNAAASNTNTSNAAATSSASNNATNSVDAAMSQVARVEASIALLSPTGSVNVHGAALLSAMSQTTPPAYDEV